MNDVLLSSYLNDHLAGSVAGVETAVRCLDHYADEASATLLRDLVREIEADRGVLKAVISRVGGEESAVKKSAAWLTEKLSRIKTAGGDGAEELTFARLEQLEALMLGIRGKLALWDVLADLATSDARLADFDWEALRRGAEDQVRRVDEQRRRAAREAFLTSGPDGAPGSPASAP